MSFSFILLIVDGGEAGTNTELIMNNLEENKK